MKLFKKLSVLSLLTVAVQVDATPGVYEINSACLDVGCFVGDNPATRTVEITQRSGTYRLTSDIFVGLNDPDAIVVDAGGTPQAITIDLNGFQMRHDSSQGVDAISIAGANTFVTIKNGSITGFNDGIIADLGATVRVEDMVFRLMGEDAVQIYSGKVLNSHFDCNTYGVYAISSTSTTIESDRLYLEGNTFSCGVTSTDQPIFSFGATNTCKDNIITYDANVNTNFEACRLVGTNVCDGIECTQGTRSAESSNKE